jgi:ElaB/YqjD/DUF883 family membrane-anchored ribosome-binding protein
MESTSADSGPTTGTDAEVGKTPTGAAAHKRRGASREVRHLTADVQDLLSRLAHVADPEIARLRAKVERALATAKRTLADGTDRVQRQAKNAMTAGDLYVRDKPSPGVRRGHRSHVGHSRPPVADRVLTSKVSGESGYGWAYSPDIWKCDCMSTTT